MTTNPLTLARQAVATLAEALTVVDLNATAYIPAMGGNFPLAFTELESSEQATTGRTLQEIDLALIVLVGDQSTREAQEVIDSLVVTGAVPAMLKANPTLLGTVTTLHYRGSEALNLVELAGYKAWGHKWLFTIFI